MEYSQPDREAAESRLVEHLVSQVRAGLAGRTGEDLVDILPSRAVFAGVLQAPRHRDEEAAERGQTSGEAPLGTALGLDFRFRPTGAGKPIRLHLSINWAHYHPVFPSYDQALQANSEGADTAMDQAESSVDPPVPDAATVVTEPADVVELAEADVVELAEADDADTTPNQSAGKVVLPRVWRRYELSTELPPVELELGERHSRSVGDAFLHAGIERVRATIAEDPRAWHHLGEIHQRERLLGTRDVLESEDSYARALHAKRGQPATPPDWTARVEVETEPDAAAKDVWRVRVSLVNVTPERPSEGVDPGLEDRAMFDSGIVVAIEGASLVPFDFVLAPKDYRTDSSMPAKGMNCSAIWRADSPNVVRSETLPVYAQPLYRTRDPLAVSFQSLAGPAAIPELRRMASEMAEYASAWQDYLESELANALTPSERAACAADKANFEAEREAFLLGVEVLERDHRLLRAFNLMNRTFGVLGERSGGKLQSWRLFQIAFICSQLPSLAARELDAASQGDYPARLRANLAEVGVLWFPTGGGKTEAYLGLIATALLYDRLRGKIRGISAWMRFPLRMLSLQQLERLGKVIAALNELRAVEPSVASGDAFAIGYYVGDNNTPNAVSVDDMQRYEGSSSMRDEVKLVRQCPHCGGPVQIRTHRRDWRLKHVCEDEQCFSNTSDSLGKAKGALPLYIVDNEVYRYLPSVLVGTVDKLAIIGRSRYFAHLVRGVRLECPEHGYTSYDECIEHWSGCKRKRSDLIRLDPVADPGPALLIQDELHLLRDELGVFNGHYEGLLSFLCSKSHLAPKVLCATATIEAYDVQAFHIYMARARRFPQPGWLAGESFYATSTPLQVRRSYVGLFNHTRAIEDSALRIVALYQRELRQLKLDPLKAAEIMGSGDRPPEHQNGILRLHDLSVCYVNRKATGGSIIEKLGRVSRSFQDERLGELNGVLLTGDQTIDEVGRTLERIEHELLATDSPRLDVLAATNLISHGVDLERINMMAICGMPSHYAEYVQATSRSARAHPGAVFVCFNSRDPRERSQFEFFYPMHEHMERLIEAVAVNRFASYAPRKTVPGLLCGLLLNLYTPELFGSAIAKPLDYIPTLHAALGFKPSKGGACLDPDELCGVIEEIIGVRSVTPPASPAQVRNAQHQVQLVFNDLMGSIGRTLETKLQDVVKPLTSFRDVDEGVEFGSIDSASLITRLRSR